MGIVEAKNLTFEYIRRDEEGNVEGITTAVDNVNIDIKAGDFVAVLGHNGSGKSTFAKHLNALVMPTEGTVYVDGMDTKDSGNTLSIRQTAGMVFQNPDNQIVGTLVDEEVGFGPENIGVPTEKNDAKKGKIFTIIGREIVMAVKAGGPDPNNNGKLRDVIAKAKANNMPNDTIERGIKKAAGADSADSYEKAVYEGYGPNGVAIIVETLTDNKNRTASNVRNAFTKGNGSIGTQGCVSYMFDQKGQIIIDKEECEMDADELMMTALDAGAEDFNEEEDSYEVLTAPDDLGAVREALEAAGVPLLEAQVAMIPQTTVELTDEKSLKDIQRILDLLDDDDDVTDVWHNWDE